MDDRGPTRLIRAAAVHGRVTGEAWREACVLRRKLAPAELALACTFHPFAT